MKKVFLISLFFSLAINAQDSDKTITLTVSGIGKTLEEAKTNALRSAIEQAFGAFISTKTEILNDTLVKDEIVSVASGNIQKFNILDEFQLLDNNWSVTLKAVVSVNKLISFVESKGITVEIKGGLFALNIEQQRLNEENEVKSIYNLSFVLQSYMQTSFDYELKVEDPISIDGGNDNFRLPITVYAKTNGNIEALNSFCLTTLQNISLNEEEISNYTKLNKPTFNIIFKSNLGEKKFYFRKKISTELLNFIFNLENEYINNFVVDLGNTKFYGNTKVTISSNDKTKTINLYSINQIVNTFNFNHNTSLNEIKKIATSKVSNNNNNQYFRLSNITTNYCDVKIEKIYQSYFKYLRKEDEVQDVEVKPEFPGGIEKLYSFVGKNFQAPEEEGLKGKVVASFIIDANGSLTNIHILMDVGYGSGKELERVLRKVPKLIPADKNGIKVPSVFSISIDVNTPE